MSYQNDKSNDYNKALIAMQNGAVIVGNDTNGFAMEYPQGGYFKITKTVYNLLTTKTK